MQHPDDMILNEYLDGNLNEPVQASVQAHLDTCAACEVRLAELQRVYAALQAWPEVALKRDLSPAVLRAIRPAQLTWLGWVLALQAVLVIALLGLAWPFVAQSGPGQALGQAISDVAVLVWQMAMAAWAGWLANWQAQLTTLREAAEQLQTPELRLPVIAVWLLLGSAGLLWLVGNGLLLRPFWPANKLKTR